MASVWDPPRPRWKQQSMEVSVSEEEGMYRATYTFWFPGADPFVQVVRGRIYQELAQKLDRQASPYMLHGRYLMWEELVEAGVYFEKLKKDGQAMIDRGDIGDDSGWGYVIGMYRWRRFKPHGPKAKREARKARIAALQRQKQKDLWDRLIRPR